MSDALKVGGFSLCLPAGRGWNPARRPDDLPSWAVNISWPWSTPPTTKRIWAWLNAVIAGDVMIDPLHPSRRIEGSRRVAQAQTRRHRPAGADRFKLRDLRLEQWDSRTPRRSRATGAQ